MRILVTGALGRLGGRLVDVLRHRSHEVVGIDLDQVDVTDFAATRTFIVNCHPELVIHAAAWTDVDGCARDPQRAIVVNGFGAQHVALGAAGVSAAVLYVSTNEVFDGRQTTPYYEYDTPSPINPYGYSKWVGERAVVEVSPKHYVVRTSWLFAHGSKNFLHTILNAAQNGKPLRVVTDEVANPTYNEDLAAAIAALIETGRYGIYHLTNAGVCSRYEFARHFLDRVGYAATPIEPITRSDWQRPSVPPAHTELGNLAARHMGITLRDWREAVDAFVKAENG
jgi:dTDP-4-dehydrorhamnose reductase